MAGALLRPPPPPPWSTFSPSFPEIFPSKPWLSFSAASFPASLAFPSSIFSPSSFLSPSSRSVPSRCTSPYPYFPSRSSSFLTLSSEFRCNNLQEGARGGRRRRGKKRERTEREGGRWRGERETLSMAALKSSGELSLDNKNADECDDEKRERKREKDRFENTLEGFRDHKSENSLYGEWERNFRVSERAVEGIPVTEEECSHLLERLLKETRNLGIQHGINIVAFSGGVDSSLAAYLVKEALPHGTTYACIGRSAALPAVQLQTARHVASSIGLTLLEVDTREGDVGEYVANEGSSCFHCKTALYSALRSVARAALDRTGGGSDVVLFNGTNADDLRDPTRLGLLAALDFRVASPLAALPKAAVRAVARHVALPNWELAAAPCLRSRLDFGVAATTEALSQVEAAEEGVRALLGIGAAENLRVRVLAGGRAVVEVDAGRAAAGAWGGEGPALEVELERVLGRAGLRLEGVRAFASGSLSRADSVNTGGRELDG